MPQSIILDKFRNKWLFITDDNGRIMIAKILNSKDGEIIVYNSS
jgi:hypothetical protein